MRVEARTTPSSPPEPDRSATPYPPATAVKRWSTWRARRSCCSAQPTSTRGRCARHQGTEQLQAQVPRFFVPEGRVLPTLVKHNPAWAHVGSWTEGHLNNQDGAALAEGRRVPQARKSHMLCALVLRAQ